MRKKYLLLFLYFFAITSFSQTSKIDSLKLEIKKNPNNVFKHRELLNFYISSGDSEAYKNEINNSKLLFLNNKDYSTFLKLSDTYLSLMNGDIEDAESKLNMFENKNDYSKLCIAKITFYYLKGYIANHNGEKKAGKLFLEKSIETIKANNLEEKYFLNIYLSYSSSVLRLGNYKEALNNFFKVLDIKGEKDKSLIYNNIGICYYNLRQLDNAERYYKLGVETAKNSNKANFTSNLAILYMERNNYKKAEETIKSLDFRLFNSIDSSAVFNVLGQIEQNKKNFNQAIKNYNIVINIDKKTNASADLANDYLAVGIMYKDNKNYKLSESNFNESYKLLKVYDDKNAEKMLLENMIDLEFSKNNNSLYTKYFKEYIDLTDSINSESVHTNASSLNLKYQTELKEAKIKTQQLQIQKEKANKNIALSGIAFILLLGFGGFWLYLNKQNQTNLKTQNTLLGLQQNLIEAELFSLNKQLDPHEIKNLLASISPEIQEKAPESYRKMLKLFNLTKASLNSTSITDSIENQLQQIDDFLSLEKSMLSIPLEYSIENNIQNTQTQIPRLLLKNLVENALKHGIKTQENGGDITVNVKEKDNFINISVDDTGKGRQNAMSLDSGIGTTTYQKLFATLNPKNKENATFEITDKTQGTKVEVKIPINYQYS